MSMILRSTVIGVFLGTLSLSLDATAQIGQNTNSTGFDTTGSTSANTPFGTLSGGGGQSGMNSSIFGGSAQTGVFGAASGDLLGAVGLNSILNGGQNQNINGGATGRTGGLTGGRTGGVGMGGGGRGGQGVQGNRNTQQGRNMGAGSRSQVVVRTRLRVGFTHPTAPPSAVISSLERSLRTPQIRIGEVPLNVSTTETARGTVAVLSGTVATPEDRLVAEQLALLEPGVWQVQNDLKVVSPAASLLPPPADLPITNSAP